jgi:hypothetical protein
MLASLQGLWAQYGFWIVAAIFVLVLRYAIPFMRKAATKWLVDRKKPWLIPLVDGAFDFAESIITVSGLGNAKRAMAIGKLTEQLGKAPSGKLLEVVDARLEERAASNKQPSLQLNPNSSTTLAGAKFGPQP